MVLTRLEKTGWLTSGQAELSQNSARPSLPLLGGMLVIVLARPVLV